MHIADVIRLLAIGGFVGLILGLILPHRATTTFVFYDDSRVDGSKLPKNEHVEFVAVRHLHDKSVCEAVMQVKFK